MSYADASLWKKEQEFLEGEKKKLPKSFEIEKKPRHHLLERIGITEKIPELPKGYLKYSPLDFIVEEILPDGTLVSADTKESGPDILLAGTGTIYADLVKVGISTLDAVQRIADGLGLEIQRIGYAGIKDAVALTGQRISIRGTTLEAVRKLSIIGVILKNIWEGKGAINTGQLLGNRFTLFIRTDGSFSEEVFLPQLEQIKQYGVMNYYGPQRFGAPRFLSHVLGRHLFKGDIEGLLKTYFTGESPFEWPYVADLRRRAAVVFGNWKAMREIFGILPYTFRIETALLSELEKINNPAQYSRGLGAISKQVDLWAKAYASYLANQVLSEAAMGYPIGEELPLALSSDKKISLIYGKYLRQDGTENFIQNLRKIPFIHIAKSPFINTRIHPKINGVKVLPEGVAVSFDLFKGAYATTVLMYMFDTLGDIPVPAWVNLAEIDSKDILGTGSIKEIKDKFGTIIENMLRNRKATGEES